MFNAIFKGKPAVDKEVEDRYDVGKKLGTGNFAVVYMVKEKVSGREYALKIISKKRVEGKEYMVQSEIDVMKKLNHPNITSLVDVIDTKKNINVVTDLASGGDLFEYVTSKGRLSETEARPLLRQILQALDYVHTQTIVHRDIKPENILLNNHTEKKIMLIDFGLATPMKDGKLLREACGSPEYVAPEQLRPQHHGYGTKADLWSVGVVAYIMLSGYHPFSAASEEDRSYLIRNGVYEFHEEKWCTVSAEGKAFVKKLIEIDTEERMDAKAALAHAWLAEDVKEDVPPALPARSTSLGKLNTPTSPSPRISPAPSPKPEERNEIPVAESSKPPVASRLDASAGTESLKSKPSSPVPAPAPAPVAAPASATNALLEDLESWKELEDLAIASRIVSREEQERMEREEREKQELYKRERERIAAEEAEKRRQEDAIRKKAQEEEAKLKAQQNQKSQQEIDDAFSELESTLSGLE